MYSMNHVYILIALSLHGCCCPFNKSLPVSKWLLLSPLQSGETGTGYNECEEVFIMNRISLLFRQTLQLHREPAEQSDENVIKCGGVNRKGGGQAGLSDKAEWC